MGAMSERVSLAPSDQKYRLSGKAATPAPATTRTRTRRRCSPSYREHAPAAGPLRKRRTLRNYRAERDEILRNAKYCAVRNTLGASAMRPCLVIQAKPRFTGAQLAEPLIHR